MKRHAGKQIAGQVHGPDACATPVGTPVGVNLLPEAIRLAQISRRRLESWAVVFAVVLLMAGGVWLWSRNRNAELRQVRTAVAQELADIRHLTKQRAALVARAGDLRQQEAVIEQMRAGESWAARLAELAAAVPDQVVLRRIETAPVRHQAPSLSAGSVAGPAAARPGLDGRHGDRPLRTTEAGSVRAATEVRIEGYAADHQVLASFLHSLQAGGVYQNVWLVRSSASKSGTTERLDFAITCLRIGRCGGRPLLR